MNLHPYRRNRPMKPRLLDLFCGAGGAAMGYHRAGFDVVSTAPPLDGLTVERLARAVLIAAREYEWRRTDDGFEWYGSADEMAEGILAALREGETP